jgi:hypothetical protein
MRRNEAGVQQAFNLAPKSLRKLAGNPGWIDQDIVTIRKMNASGATLIEIGKALGWTAQKVRYRMKRDGIPFCGRHDCGDKRAERTSLGHRKHGRGLWHDRAIELKAAGLKTGQIAAILGFPPDKISKFFSKRRIADLYPRERRSA